MLDPLADLTFAERRAGAVVSLSVDGEVGVVGASRIGRRLLALFNDNSYRVLLDLSRAEPIADCALLGTLLRLDRYATQRGARLIVVSGDAMDRALHLGNTRGLLTIAATREQAESLLG